MKAFVTSLWVVLIHISSALLRSLADWDVSSLTVRGILMLQSGRKVLYFGDRWWHHLLRCHLCLSCHFGMFTRCWRISGVNRKCPTTNGSWVHTAKPQKKSGPGMFEQEHFADSRDKCYSAPIGLGSVLLWIKGFIELNWCIELPSSGKGGHLKVPSFSCESAPVHVSLYIQTSTFPL